MATKNGANGSSPPRSAPEDYDAVANGDITILEHAAIRGLHARDITMERSAVGVLHAGRATLVNSNSGVVVARSAACDEVRIGVLAAPVVRGEVHTLIDLRSAVALGLGIVLGKALLAGGRGLLLRLRA